MGIEREREKKREIQAERKKKRGKGIVRKKTEGYISPFFLFFLHNEEML